MRGGRGSAVTTALIVVLVLAVGGMAAYIFMSRNAPAPQAEEKEMRSYVITEENADEAIEQIKKRKSRAVSSYTALMNSEWHFPDGASPSTDAYVANDKSNKCDVWFDVTLDDGRTVYESPILPVDTHIRNFALTEALEAGTYGATVTYHLVDEEQEELSTVSVGVSIIVEG